MSPRAISCGAFKLTASGIVSYDGMTTSKVDSHGKANRYEVRGPGVHLTIDDMTWETGDRDVRTVNRHSSPMKFDRLVHGLRIGVHDHLSDRGTALRMDLKQTQITDPKKWPGVRQADLAMLNAGADCDVAAVLTAHGATLVDTREIAYGDTSTHQNTVCVLFPRDAVLVPPLAYLLTRIAPLAKDFSAGGRPSARTRRPR